MTKLACPRLRSVSQPRVRALWLGALLALCAGLTLLQPVARALPPEYLSNAAFHPTDPNMLVVRWESAQGGVLITRDGGKSFRALPASAFYKYGLVNRVPLRVASDGSVLIGVSDGFFEDDGTGCNVGQKHDAELGGQWVADIAPHPSDVDTTFLVTTGDSMGKHAGLWKRAKGGAVTALGVSEPLMAGKPGVVIQGLAVVPHTAAKEGVRFVETGTRQVPMSAQQMATTSAVVRFSDDLGATWTEHAVPDPDKTQGVVRLLAVEPGEPMKLVVSLEVSSGATDQSDPIFVSTDSGASFKLYTKEIVAAGPALRLANGQLLLGDSGSAGGLWLADGIGMPLRKIADYSVKCLAQQPKDGKVVMCKPYEVGFLDVAKGEFCGIFQINETEGLVSCPSADLASNMSVQSQLCGAWCGPAHYAFTPMCAIYNNPKIVCGIQARQWDTMEPEPSKRWIEPPGDFAAPRCAGFERVVLGSDAGVSDAGAGPSDAGAPSASDADVAPEKDASTGSTRADSGSATKPKSDDSGGCSVALRARSQHSVAWLALALFSLLAWRRRSARA